MSSPQGNFSLYVKNWSQKQETSSYSGEDFFVHKVIGNVFLFREKFFNLELFTLRKGQGNLSTQDVFPYFQKTSRIFLIEDLIF